MEKNRDKAALCGDNLEIHYANLLSKSKLMETDLKKEILELKILYESEKEKSSSLEKSIKNYPSKVSALEHKLNQETALRKSLESTLEECSNLKHKESLETEVKRYQTACSQLQSENRLLNQQYLNTLNDKNEIQKKLTEYIDFLNKKNEKIKEEHERAIEEIKFEENERRIHENKELKKEIEHLNTQISHKKQKVSLISQKYQDSRDFQLKIAVKVDEKESLIRKLQKQNKELLGKSYFADSENSYNADDMYNNLEKLKHENLHLKQKIQTKKDKFYKKKEKYMKEINQTTGKVKDLENIKSKLEIDTASLRSKIHEQSETIRSIQIKLKDTEEEHSEIVKKTKQSLKPIMIKLRTERDSFKAQLEEFYKSADHSPVRSHEPSLYEELSDLKNHNVESLELELSKISDEKSELQKEFNCLNCEVSAKNKFISELQSEIESLKQVVSALSAKDKAFTDLQNQNKELDSDINHLKSQISRQDKNINILEKQRTKNLNTIQELRTAESKLKAKEKTISELKNQNSELQKEVDLLQKLNSEIIQKELTITEVPDAETDIRIPDLAIRIDKESFSATADESDRNTDHFNSQIFEKESVISQLYRDKNDLNLQIDKLQRENEDLISQSSLQVLSPKCNGRNGITAVLELESERDMLKSEILRLETQLKLSNQEWSEYSNQLYQELVKEHDQKIKLIERKTQRKTIKQPLSARISWWKRRIGNSTE